MSDGATMPSRAARTAQLQQRQWQLLQRSAQLRGDVAQAWQGVQRPLSAADLVLAGWLWLRRHPELPLVATLVLVVLRPRRVWRWGGRLWWVWRRWRRVQRWLDTGR